MSLGTKILDQIDSIYQIFIVKVRDAAIAKSQDAKYEFERQRSKFDTINNKLHGNSCLDYSGQALPVPVFKTLNIEKCTCRSMGLTPKRCT